MIRTESREYIAHTAMMRIIKIFISNQKKEKICKGNEENSLEGRFNGQRKIDKSLAAIP